MGNCATIVLSRDDAMVSKRESIQTISLAPTITATKVTSKENNNGSEHGGVQVPSPRPGSKNQGCTSAVKYQMCQEVNAEEGLPAITTGSERHGETTIISVENSLRHQTGENSASPSAATTAERTPAVDPSKDKSTGGIPSSWSIPTTEDQAAFEAILARYIQLKWAEMGQSTPAVPVTPPLAYSLAAREVIVPPKRPVGEAFDIESDDENPFADAPTHGHTATKVSAAANATPKIEVQSSPLIAVESSPLKSILKGGSPHSFRPFPDLMSPDHNTDDNSVNHQQLHHNTLGESAFFSSVNSPMAHQIYHNEGISPLSPADRNKIKSKRHLPLKVQRALMDSSTPITIASVTTEYKLPTDEEQEAEAVQHLKDIARERELIAKRTIRMQLDALKKGRRWKKEDYPALASSDSNTATKEKRNRRGGAKNTNNNASTSNADSGDWPSVSAASALDRTFLAASQGYLAEANTEEGEEEISPGTAQQKRSVDGPPKERAPTPSPSSASSAMDDAERFLLEADWTADRKDETEEDRELLGASESIPDFDLHSSDPLSGSRPSTTSTARPRTADRPKSGSRKQLGQQSRPGSAFHLSGAIHSAIDKAGQFREILDLGSARDEMEERDRIAALQNPLPAFELGQREALVASDAAMRAVALLVGVMDRKHIKEAAAAPLSDGVGTSYLLSHQDGGGKENANGEDGARLADNPQKEFGSGNGSESSDVPTDDSEVDDDPANVPTGVEEGAISLIKTLFNFTDHVVSPSKHGHAFNFKVAGEDRSGTLASTYNGSTMAGGTATSTQLATFNNTYGSIQSSLHTGCTNPLPTPPPLLPASLIQHAPLATEPKVGTKPATLAGASKALDTLRRGGNPSHDPPPPTSLRQRQPSMENGSFTAAKGLSQRPSLATSSNSPVVGAQPPQTLNRPRKLPPLSNGGSPATTSQGLAHSASNTPRAPLPSFTPRGGALSAPMPTWQPVTHTNSSSQQGTHHGPASFISRRGSSSVQQQQQQQQQPILPLGDVNPSTDRNAGSASEAPDSQRFQIEHANCIYGAAVVNPPTMSSHTAKVPMPVAKGKSPLNELAPTGQVLILDAVALRVQVTKLRAQAAVAGIRGGGASAGARNSSTSAIDAGSASPCTPAEQSPTEVVYPSPGAGLSPEVLTIRQPQQHNPLPALLAGKNVHVTPLAEVPSDVQGFTDTVRTFNATASNFHGMEGEDDDEETSYPTSPLNAMERKAKAGVKSFKTLNTIDSDSEVADEGSFNERRQRRNLKRLKRQASMGPTPRGTQMEEAVQFPEDGAADHQSSSGCTTTTGAPTDREGEPLHGLLRATARHSDEFSLMTPERPKPDISLPLTEKLLPSAASQMPIPSLVVDAPQPEASNQKEAAYISNITQMKITLDRLATELAVVASEVVTGSCAPDFLSTTAPSRGEGQRRRSSLAISPRQSTATIARKLSDALSIAVTPRAKSEQPQAQVASRVIICQIPRSLFPVPGNATAKFPIDLQSLFAALSMQLTGSYDSADAVGLAIVGHIIRHSVRWHRHCREAEAAAKLSLKGSSPPPPLLPTLKILGPIRAFGQTKKNATSILEAFSTATSSSYDYSLLYPSMEAFEMAVVSLTTPPIREGRHPQQMSDPDMLLFAFAASQTFKMKVCLLTPPPPGSTRTDGPPRPLVTVFESAVPLPDPAPSDYSTEANELGESANLAHVMSLITQKVSAVYVASHRIAIGFGMNANIFTSLGYFPHMTL